MSNRKHSDTSSAAYRELHPNQVANHHGKILSAMRIFGQPLSMEQAADKAGLTYEQTHKRFAELQREGLIRQDGKGKTKAGRLCWLYSIVKQSNPEPNKIEDMDNQTFFEKFQNGEFEPPSNPNYIQATLL